MACLFWAAIAESLPLPGQGEARTGAEAKNTRFRPDFAFGQNIKVVFILGTAKDLPEESATTAIPLTGSYASCIRLSITLTSSLFPDGALQESL